MRKIKGMAQFKKRWLSLAEAASELSTDEEGLRQAMESGDLNELPVFVYSGAGRFPAQIVDLDEEGDDFDDPPQGDSEGDVVPQCISGEPSYVWVWLTGCFRLTPESVKSVAKERTLFQCFVSPCSWWAKNCQVPKHDDSAPRVQFWLGASDAEYVEYPHTAKGLDPIFSFDNLRFSAEDIAAIKAGSSSTGDVGSGELSTQESPGVVAKWPWGAHETQALRYLDAAAKQWWQRYDPADPTTAHTNEEVVGWLIKEHGVSDRLAKSIASILRADGLPSGPRR